MMIQEVLISQGTWLEAAADRITDVRECNMSRFGQRNERADPLGHGGGDESAVTLKYLLESLW